MPDVVWRLVTDRASSLLFAGPTAQTEMSHASATF